MGYMLLLVEEGVTRSASGPDHDAWTSEGQSLSGWPVSEEVSLTGEYWNGERFCMKVFWIPALAVRLSKGYGIGGSD